MGRWSEARTAKEKLDASFSFGKYPWGPGEVLRYNNINTFILTAAMDGFLKRQAGPQAQLWDRWWPKSSSRSGSSMRP